MDKVQKHNSFNVFACLYLNWLQFQHINTSCVELVVLIRCVFLCSIAEMSDQFLQQ
jgi:hypothetical protein